MCLIAYVRAGKTISDHYIETVHARNPDGIGVMSAKGIEKFLGHKMLKRARRYIHTLQNDGLEFAVHFRYATHGDITMKNVHPFELPDGNGHLMHNGVLSDYTEASIATNGEDSDTALFAREHIGTAPFEQWQEYWTAIANKISGGRLCLMLPDKRFILVNEQSGTWKEDVWYSQTYSLPYNVKPYVYSGGAYEYWRGRGNEDAYDGSYSYSHHRAPFDGIATWWRKAKHKQDKVDNTTDVYYKNLDAAYARRYGDNQTPPSHWLGWDKDKDGNLPETAPEDKALDAVVTEHLGGEDCTLPGWSESVAKPELACIDCGGPREASSAWCGPGYCTGEGYKETQCRICSE